MIFGKCENYKEGRRNPHPEVIETGKKFGFLDRDFAVSPNGKTKMVVDGITYVGVAAKYIYDDKKEYWFGWLPENPNQIKIVSSPHNDAIYWHGKFILDLCILCDVKNDGNTYCRYSC